MYDVYVIADLHFGDPNIIKFENTPFVKWDDIKRNDVPSIIGG
jgi:calcineurin-like phosphoesterase family protein